MGDFSKCVSKSGILLYKLSVLDIDGECFCNILEFCLLVDCGKVVDNWWKNCGLPNKKRRKICSSSFGIVYVQ